MVRTKRDPRNNNKLKVQTAEHTWNILSRQRTRHIESSDGGISNHPLVNRLCFYKRPRISTVNEVLIPEQIAMKMMDTIFRRCACYYKNTRTTLCLCKRGLLDLKFTSKTSLYKLNVFPVFKATSTY